MCERRVVAWGALADPEAVVARFESQTGPNPTAHGRRNLRIVSWNVRGAGAASPAWLYFLECAPDLALLQEVGVPSEAVARQYSILAESASRKNGIAQRFKTAILARGTIGRVIGLRSPRNWVNAELDRFLGNLVASKVRLSGGLSLNAVSVYSPAWPIDRARLTGIDVNEVRLALNPDVWVADVLWDALRTRIELDHDHWVVAGDFNLSETFDLWRGGPRGNREYLDRMAALELVECLRASRGALTPTFRNSDGRTVKHQMDHLFVSKALATRLTRCDVGAERVVFGDRLSDHLPVIADFD